MMTAFIGYDVSLPCNVEIKGNKAIFALQCSFIRVKYSWLMVFSKNMIANLILIVGNHYERKQKSLVLMTCMYGPIYLFLSAIQTTSKLYYRVVKKRRKGHDHHPFLSSYRFFLLSLVHYQNDDFYFLRKLFIQKCASPSCLAIQNLERCLPLLSLDKNFRLYPNHQSFYEKKRKKQRRERRGKKERKGEGIILLPAISWEEDRINDGHRENGVVFVKEKGKKILWSILETNY